MLPLPASAALAPPVNPWGSATAPGAARVNPSVPQVVAAFARWASSRPKNERDAE